MNPSLPARYAVLMALLAFSILGTYAARGLYADGSWFLINILERGAFYDFDKPRAYAQMVTQLPIVLAIRLGVEDLNVLVRLHSFGLVAVPILVWATALWMSLRSPMFWMLLLGLAVTLLTSGFFAVGEYNLAYAVAALCISILLRNRIGLPAGCLLIGGALLLVRAYEASLFLGPLLALTSLYRARQSETDSTATRLGITAAAALFAYGSWIALQSVLHPRSPTNFAEAANVLDLLDNWHFQHLVVMLGGALLAAWKRESRFFRVLLSWALAVLSLVYLAGAADWHPPGAHYSFRTLSGILLFGIFLVAVFARFWKGRSAGSIPARTESAAPVALLLFVALFVAGWARTVEFQDWAKAFERESLQLTKHVAIDKTGLAGTPMSFVWAWTNPSLSILLRGDTDALILNASDYAGWQPFDPRTLQRNPVQRYPKRGLLYP